VADTSFVCQSGAYQDALDAMTRYANATMHLFIQGFSPTPTSSLASFQANEATFDGYTAATLAEWSEPILAGSAWAIEAPTQIFRWVFASGVGNMIQGYWLQDSAGNLIDYTVFDPAESVASFGQAVQRTPVEVFPWG